MYYYIETASKSEVTSTEELSPLQECREPAIEEFPKDLFTKAQLQSGWITIHILVTIYLFYALAIVCDDYFVPSVEIMAKGWKNILTLQPGRRQSKYNSLLDALV